MARVVTLYYIKRGSSTLKIKKVQREVFNINLRGFLLEDILKEVSAAICAWCDDFNISYEIGLSFLTTLYRYGCTIVPIVRPKMTERQWLNMLSWADFRCVCCKRKFTPKCGLVGPLEKGHVLARVFGGDESPYNIQPLCRECNSKQGVRTVDYRDGHHPNLNWDEFVFGNVFELIPYLNIKGYYKD